MKEKVPRISNREASFSEEFFSKIKSVFHDVTLFLSEYGLLILGTLLVLGSIFWIWRRFYKRKKQIEKVWIYILFFLTKRQMLIPLVITLSKKDKILDPETQEKLLSIREKCRDVSLKKNPHQRMQLEKEVSEILFFYFSQLEKKQAIVPGSKFEKIVRDLEFIDAKLVQLQRVYNHEVEKWNKQVNFPVLGIFLRIAGFEAFQKFED